MEEVYKNELDIMRLRHLKISGTSNGWGARDVCPLVSNSFIFMQFWQEFWKIIGWLTPIPTWELAPLWEILDTPLKIS